MPRPPKKRYVKHRPRISKFAPMIHNKVPNNLNKISLTLDQLEALRLADLEGLSQEEAARMMNVSRQTFGRIVEQAREVVANALINGKSIEIVSDEHIEIIERNLKCIECGHEWEQDGILYHDKILCPECSSMEVIKMRRCGKKCECPLRINVGIGCK